MLLAPCSPQSRGFTPTRTPSAESGFPPEQGCKSLLPSAESGFCHPNKVASPSTQPGFLSYPRWDRAEPKNPASDPEPNADASGPFLTWDAVDNKVLIFLPLSAVSNDEGELPHIQKSDEKESRSTTFIHCDACASSKTGEGELVSNGLVGPPVCGVGLRRGARPTLPNTMNPEDHSMFPKTRHPTLSTTDY